MYVLCLAFASRVSLCFRLPSNLCRPREIVEQRSRTMHYQPYREGRRGHTCIAKALKASSATRSRTSQGSHRATHSTGNPRGGAHTPAGTDSDPGPAGSSPRASPSTGAPKPRRGPEDAQEAAEAARSHASRGRADPTCCETPARRARGRRELHTADSKRPARYNTQQQRHPANSTAPRSACPATPHHRRPRPRPRCTPRSHGSRRSGQRPPTSRHATARTYHRRPGSAAYRRPATHGDAARRPSEERGPAGTVEAPVGSRKSILLRNPR